MPYLASPPSSLNQRSSNPVRTRKPTARRRTTTALMEAVEARQFLTVTPSWVEVPISAAAKTSDSTLNNYRTFDLRVSVTTGDDWVGTSMKATLTSGRFYIPATSNSNGPQKNLWSLKPSLEFDTFVGAENFTSPTLLGLSSFPPNRPGSASFTSTSIDATWGGFAKVSGGTYTIARLTIQNGSVGTVQAYVTHAADEAQKIGANANLPLGGTVAGGSIAGKVWNDANGNGILDTGEVGVSGRTVYLDSNNNVVMDSTEKRTTTDTSGNYKFTGLAAGTYKIREILASGWIQTNPTNNFGDNATLTTNQVVTGKNFGTRQANARISGTVFHDYNRNGIRDTGDNGLSGWTVWIDTDNDSILDSTERRTTTDASGNYSFGSLVSGTYKIRVVRQTGWVQTIPTSNFGHSVTLSAGQQVGGKLTGMDN
jgi:uncharacterized protein (DUF2141 family)